MIDIKSLTEKDKGRRVIYRPDYREQDERQDGILKSWNDKNIFVVYHWDGDSGDYRDYTAASTTPSDLEFKNRS